MKYLMRAEILLVFLIIFSLFFTACTDKSALLIKNQDSNPKPEETKVQKSQDTSDDEALQEEEPAVEQGSSDRESNDEEQNKILEKDFAKLTDCSIFYKMMEIAKNMETNELNLQILTGSVAGCMSPCAYEYVANDQEYDCHNLGTNKDECEFHNKNAKDNIEMDLGGSPIRNLFLNPSSFQCNGGEDCLQTRAKLLNNPDICESLRSSINECKLGVAVYNKNMELCKDLGEDLITDFCERTFN